jgi:hypothetical protein
VTALIPSRRAQRNWHTRLGSINVAYQPALSAASTRNVTLFSAQPPDAATAQIDFAGAFRDHGTFHLYNPAEVIRDHSYTDGPEVRPELIVVRDVIAQK